jgi:hypothetical protein
MSRACSTHPPPVIELLDALAERLGVDDDRHRRLSSFLKRLSLSLSLASRLFSCARGERQGGVSQPRPKRLANAPMMGTDARARARMKRGWARARRRRGEVVCVCARGEVCAWSFGGL